MEITINVPDQLTEKIKDQWGDLSTKIVSNLVLIAFGDGLINLNELQEILNLSDEEDLGVFLKDNYLLHNSGLLNLYGSCADIDFGDDNLGIVDDLDSEIIGVVDD